MAITQKEADQLNAAQAEVKKLWVAACEFDNIDPTTKFAMFSFGNPHTPKHGESMTAFMKLRNRIARASRRRENAGLPAGDQIKMRGGMMHRSMLSSLPLTEAKGGN